MKASDDLADFWGGIREKNNYIWQAYLPERMNSLNSVVKIDVNR